MCMNVCTHVRTCVHYVSSNDLRVYVCVCVSQDLFPSADVGRMLGRAPALLLRTPQDLKDTAAKLRELLKTQHVDT